MLVLKSILNNTLKSIVPSTFFNKRNYAQPMVPEHEYNDFEIKNEQPLQYLKDSKERKELEEELEKFSCTETVIPILIGEEEVTSKDVQYQVMPHCHGKKLAKYYLADEGMVKKAIGKALDSQVEWDGIRIMDRIAIWLKAADLIAGKYRQKLNAATMLGQGKTVYQAEIDAACELADFMRWNAYYLKELIKYKPISPNDNTKNTFRYRGLDGFVAAISPFNFTAIGGNLAYTPALCGNAVLWKPSPTAMLSNWIIYQVMAEVGVPPGIVNFIPTLGPTFGEAITSSPCLAAINFTGSVATFQKLWELVGGNISKFNVYPRMLGECGGKNFHLVHPSADPCAVISSTIRAAFEYSGQKCSACSRLYVPESLWKKIKPELVELTQSLKVGDVKEFENFTGAVIDKAAFDKIVSYIEYARSNSKLKIIAGGNYNHKVGYFICPTIIETEDPLDKIMQEEIFGPVLAVYVYKENELDQIYELIRRTTRFALTGSIFTEDEKFICKSLRELKYAAGNFYINTKCTSAVVGQQPFGGGKLSGTNDKPGGPHYPLRFLSPQSFKEDIVPDKEIFYPYMVKPSCHSIKI